MGPHPSHKTRFSDSSFYDECCINCGATDQIPGGWGELANPCMAPEVYVDLLLWTMRWYREFVENTASKTVVACSKDLDRLRKQYDVA